MTFFSLCCCNESIFHRPSRCDGENPSFFAAEAMPPIQRLRRFLAFLHVSGRRERKRGGGGGRVRGGDDGPVYSIVRC